MDRSGDRRERGGRGQLLYLDTRSLPIERSAEVLAAVDAGYGVVMATPSPELFHSYGLDHVIPAPVGEYDAAERIILEELRRRGLAVRGILAWKDREVELAARLAVALGLPGTPPECVPNVRNKARTRRVLDPLGTANPRYAPVPDEAAFRAGLERVGLPGLLKPAGNSGSRGVFSIGPGDDPLAVYREFRRYNAAQAGEMYAYYADVPLLEEALQGEEHSVAGVVVDSRVVVFAIADKKMDRSVPIQYQNTVPSRLPLDVQRTLVATARAAVEATGINWCGFHVDLMRTDRGPKVLEVGGRLGGECINSHLIPLSQPWLRPYPALLEVAQGNNPLTKDDYTRDAVRRAGTRILVPPGPGRIVSVEGLERVWRHPHTRVFMQMHGVGNVMARPRDRFKAYEIGYVIAQCSLEEDLDAILDEIASLVTVEVEPTDDPPPAPS